MFESFPLFNHVPRNVSQRIGSSKAESKSNRFCQSLIFCVSKRTFADFGPKMTKNFLQRPRLGGVVFVAVVGVVVVFIFLWVGDPRLVSMPALPAAGS